MPDLSPEELLKIAAEAAENAYAPYSKFRVGAAILMEGGSVFKGCNVENVSYGLTICAERSAVFSAVAAGERKIAVVAIVASGEEMPYPCGACRQVLAEFADSEVKVFMAPIKKLDTYESATMAELLPKAFKFER